MKTDPELYDTPAILLVARPATATLLAHWVCLGNRWQVHMLFWQATHPKRVLKDLLYTSDAEPWLPHMEESGGVHTYPLEVLVVWS